MAGLRAGIAGFGLAMLVSGCGLLGAEPAAEDRTPPGGSAGNGGSVAPGSAGSAVAGNGGATGVSGVAPEVSQHWTWHECGRISPSSTDERRHDGSAEILSLALSSDGSLLLSDAYQTIAWRVAEAFGDSEPLWQIGVEGGINVALSPDARLATLSGDVRGIFDTSTGKPLLGEYVDFPVPNGGDPDAGPACFGSEFNFSPDSKLVAGKHYGSTVEVIETEGLTRIGYLDTPSCAQGVTFSSDGGNLVTPDASAELAQLATKLPPSHSPDVRGWRWQSLTRAPDGGMVRVTCDSDTCTAAGIVWSGLGGRHLAISPEGQWAALGGKLHHLPSGEERPFDDVATEAVFAPNGDVIAGERDASLVRFCRAD